MDLCLFKRMVSKRIFFRKKVMMMKMQDEWVCILPIVIHRILTQYQDIQNYKKVNLHHLIYNRSSDPPTLTSLITHQGETLKVGNQHNRPPSS